MKFAIDFFNIGKIFLPYPMALVSNANRAKNL